MFYTDLYSLRETYYRRSYIWGQHVSDILKMAFYSKNGVPFSIRHTTFGITHCETHSFSFSMGITPYSLEVVSENKQNLRPWIDIHIFASGTLDIRIYMHMVMSDTVHTRNSAKLAKISNGKGN
jgi:hypothetical protein